MPLIGNFGSLPLLSNPLGSHDTTLIDTGVILGEDDPVPNSALIDLDVDGGARPQEEIGAVSIGLLPEPTLGQTLVDADLFSGSYGAGEAVVIDVGPDGFGPLVTGSLLAQPENPFDVNVTEVPLTDILQGDNIDTLIFNVIGDAQEVLGGVGSAPTDYGLLGF